MQNIFVFGGSFDPVHKGHLALIDEVFKRRLADLFFLVPTGNHPEGKTHYFSAIERMILLKLSCGLLLSEDELHYLRELGVDFTQENKVEREFLSIREDEISSDQRSHTISLIDTIKSEFPHATIHLLVGEDQAQKFSSWHKADELAEKTSLWVYHRNGAKLDDRFIWNVIEAESFDISSSQIRDWLIQADQEFHNSDLVPELVKKIAPSFFKNKD
ncbi:MAG: nicotinate-nicotinamide nucleotide adenylyltransferase [Brevinema sp.]